MSASEHVLSVSRFQRGMTVSAPARPVYGTAARCSCGAFRERVNVAPSKGGRSTVTRRWRAHVREVDHSC